MFCVSLVGHLRTDVRGPETEPLRSSGRIWGLGIRERRRALVHTIAAAEAMCLLFWCCLRSATVLLSFVGHDRKPRPSDTVQRRLADPTKRTVFEWVVRSEEITGVELTRESALCGPHVYCRARPEDFAPLVDWISYYGVFLVRAVPPTCEPS
jgi:hypothetical protein